jgi:hypothetical protein
MRSDQRVAVVTGSSSGNGYETSLSVCVFEFFIFECTAILDFNRVDF